MTAPNPSDPVLLLYVAAFSTAAIACLWSTRRVDGVRDADTRRGLRALLLTSGGWAATHVAFLVLPTATAKTTAYTAGLVLGFATVGAWLYFASAYTGRTYHRDQRFRRLAVLVFLGVVAIKLTNPIHGAYYTTTHVTDPFPHRAIASGTLHWIAMGLSYALAFVGYFMLVELFTEVDVDTRPLTALLAITGLPVALDVVGFATPILVDITYEPLGVAVFAIGTTVAYTERFETVRFAAERDEPTIALDTDRTIRDVNHAAASAFPALADAYDRALADVAPAIQHTLDSDDDVLTHSENGDTAYYHVTTTAYGTGDTALGRKVVLTDVTEREQYRRQLERQNERLETFTSMVGHDLRNPLNVARGQCELVREDLPADHDAADAVEESLDRMQTLVDEILELAKQGQPVDDTQPLHLEAIATSCWTMVDTADATLDLRDDVALHADPDRLKRLLENLIRNAVDHAGPDVTITIGALTDGDATGFYLEDDGPGIPPDDRDSVLETGYSTNDGTGFGLAIVAEIADAHGWTLTITDAPHGGARFEFTDVDLEHADHSPEATTTDPPTVDADPSNDRAPDPETRSGTEPAN